MNVSGSRFSALGSDDEYGEEFHNEAIAEELEGYRIDVDGAIVETQQVVNGRRLVRREGKRLSLVRIPRLSLKLVLRMS